MYYVLNSIGGNTEFLGGGGGAIYSASDRWISIGGGGISRHASISGPISPPAIHSQFSEQG